ncbi:MAG: NAD(P)H-hydrate dehydratase [Actinomycetia bacterium]|nr:NAD(P)H-hydrate dehydratase [Actinomycetes bacterium]
MSLPVEVAPAVLAGRPLPVHDDGASKHDRGSLLVVGGSCETPGAVLLAGLAALRVGAGRLALATAGPVVPPLAVAVPEARVTALAATEAGAIDPEGADRVAELAHGADAVLIGPGMLDVDAAEPLLDALTQRLATTDAVLVVDAGALPAAGRHPDWIRRLGGRALLVPNPDELEVLGVGTALAGAERFDAVVSARGPDTEVAAPDGGRWLDHHGAVGLATSGSGDVAAGIAAGLVTRGADPVTAAVWAAALHGRAGERLAERIAPIGFLARELLDELPATLRELQSRRQP